LDVPLPHAGRKAGGGVPGAPGPPRPPPAAPGAPPGRGPPPPPHPAPPTQGPADDDETGPDGVPSFREWELPSRELHGSWETLHYDIDIKDRLLR